MSFYLTKFGLQLAGGFVQNSKITNVFKKLEEKSQIINAGKLCDKCQHLPCIAEWREVGFQIAT